MLEDARVEMRTLSTIRVRRSVTGIRELERINPIATPRMRGDNWMRTRARWFRLNPLCVMCHANGFIQLANQLDHVIPLYKGGADDESNYQSLCVECHKIKSAEERK